MTPDSRSERLLRATLDRNPSPRVHKRRHSHIPPPSSTDDDDQLFRAAFLYRTPATSSPHYTSQRTSHSPSPTRDYNYYSHHTRPASPSPTPSRRQSLQRSMDSQYQSMISSANLQRHNSTPARRRSNVTDLPLPHALPLTPHEQVLRARLERVLLSGKVVDEKRHVRRSSRDDAHWPWSDPSLSASTPPKSESSSDHGHGPSSYYHYQGHQRSRSKTDPLTSPPLPPVSSPRRATCTYGTTTPVLASPYLAPQHKHSPSIRAYYHPSHPGLTQRNNSHSSTSTQVTPPLTADASPVLGEPHNHLIGEEEDADIEDERLLLTPPPTPPLFGAATSTTTATATPNHHKRPTMLYHHSRTPTTDPSIGTRSGPASPYLYPYPPSFKLDSDVQSLDLSSPLTPSHCVGTFNARKASERCRLMEGYVSFAAVEGLGTPPDGVDDSVGDGTGELDGSTSVEDKGEKRGRGLIGTWARKLFVTA